MILPEEYQGMSEDELEDRINEAKDMLGDELVILGHHYQRDDVYSFADFTGDSFKLARDAAGQERAKYIVFCGVHFMAEAARILCREDQGVFLPDMDAGCPMADMANINDVEEAWDSLSDITDLSRVIPIAYMNSSAEVKAFCGINEGIVCTSNSAGKALQWALSKGDKVFFLPDQHLGINAARAMGINRGQISTWRHDEFEGGLAAEDIGRSKVIVWNGFCHVHTFFTMDHVKEIRERYPNAKIIVHPECTEDVVMASDEAGSTEQIKKYVEAAPEGSTIVVGTEINMVNRLAFQNRNKNVYPLARSICPNMLKISLNDLCWTLEKIGEVNEVIVDENITTYAKLALQKMLENL